MASVGGDGSITLTTKVDQSGLKTGLGAIGNSVKKIGAAIGIAFGVKALVDFGKTAITLASDLQEVQNVVDTAFGEMSYKIEQFAETSIESFGISRLTAKRTASTYMAMAKGMGIAEDTASDMAITMTGLTADISSFYNISQERADTILKSVYTGETEALKQLGIVMTEVNLEQFAQSKGITKSISSMNQQEKTMLRYQFVLEQTRLAQGDFAKTSDSWANQTRILSERWKEMQSVFGQAFMNFGRLALPVLNNIISNLTKVANVAKQASEYIYELFTGKSIESSEKQAEAISGAVQNQNDLTAAVEETEKAQKGALAGFDEINTLADSAGANASVGGSIGDIFDSSSVENVEDTSKELPKVNKSLEALQKALKPLQDISFGNLTDSLKKLKDALNPYKDLALEGLEWLWYEILVPLAEWTIEDLLPTFLDLLAGALDALTPILEAAKPYLDWLWKEFIKPLAEETAEIAIGILEWLVDVLNDFADWANENPEEMDNACQIILSFLAGLVTYLIVKNLVSVFGTLVKHFGDFKVLCQLIAEQGFFKTITTLFGGTSLSNIQLWAIAIGVVVGSIAYLAMNWDKLSPAQRTITILSSLAAAATAAAVAIALFHTSWSVGIAAAAIAGGVALLAGTYLFKSYNGKKNVSGGGNAPSDISQYSYLAEGGTYKFPALAKGTVLPGGKPFLAWVNDQPAGHTNIEAPLDTIVEAFNIALSRNGGRQDNRPIVLQVDGREIARATREGNASLGTQTVFGGFANAY